MFPARRRISTFVVSGAKGCGQFSGFTIGPGVRAQSPGLWFVTRGYREATRSAFRTKRGMLGADVRPNRRVRFWHRCRLAASANPVLGTDMRRQDLGDELSADDLDRYASKAPKLVRRILAGQVIDVDWMPVEHPELS
jgi:hypothetical protein